MKAFANSTMNTKEVLDNLGKANLGQLEKAAKAYSHFLQIIRKILCHLLRKRSDEHALIFLRADVSHRAGHPSVPPKRESQ